MAWPCLKVPIVLSAAYTSSWGWCLWLHVLLPFFLQCARDIVRLLLSHRANPNMLWSGHSPLSLSIASGNDLVSLSAPMNLIPLHLNTQHLPWAPASCVPGFYAHSSCVHGHQATVLFLPPLTPFFQSATGLLCHFSIYWFIYPISHSLSHLATYMSI